MELVHCFSKRYNKFAIAYAYDTHITKIKRTSVHQGGGGGLLQMNEW